MAYGLGHDGTVTIGIAQWFPQPGEPAANLRVASDALRTLAERGCEVAVLPELWLCGYRPSTLARDARAAAQPIGGEASEAIARIAAESRMAVCAGSVPESYDGRIYNTSVLYDSAGEVILVHRKVYQYGTECDVFESGSGFSTASLGGIGTVGVCICFDGDFPESARTLRHRGARVVFHPCAYETGTRRWWDLLYPANALSNGQWWISCNQRGGDGPDGFFGDSRIIAPSGEVVARAAVERDSLELVVAAVPIAEELTAADAESSSLFRSLRPEVHAGEANQSAAG